MEELRVEVLLVMKHAPDRVEQAAHDGDDRHLLLLAAGEEGFIGGLDLRAALDGDQGGHEEGQAQMAVAGAADVARGVGGAALAGPRIESGVGHPLLGFQVLGQDEQFAQQTQGAELADAGHTAQPLDLGGEVRFAGGEFGGAELQGFDPLLEMADVDAQVGGDESVAIGSESDGMETGLLAGEFAAELDEPPAEVLQGEHGVGGWRPREELHALEELEDAQRIDLVGLGAGQPGTLEVFDRPWIDDHHFDALGPLEGERQAQAVNTGGLETDAGTGTAPVQELDQLPVAGGRVRQGAGAFGLAVAEDRHDQFTGADIDAGADLRRFFGLFHGGQWV